MSFGQASGTVAFGATWFAYIDLPTLTGVASPAVNFTSDPRNLLYRDRYEIASGTAPASSGSGGSVGLGGGGSGSGSYSPGAGSHGAQIP